MAGTFSILDKVKEQVEEVVGGDEEQTGTTQPASTPTATPAASAARNVQYSPDPTGNPPGIMYSTLLTA